jgi:hypothetical protein
MSSSSNGSHRRDPRTQLMDSAEEAQSAWEGALAELQASESESRGSVQS